MSDGQEMSNVDIDIDVQNPWRRTVEQRIKVARDLKAQALSCFKGGDYRSAGLRYSQALKCLIPVLSGSDEELRTVEELKLGCYANLAACQLKEGQFDHVVTNSSKVLERDCDHVKSLYRRGLGYLEINEFDKARVDIERGRRLEPNNRSFQDLYVKLQRKVRQQNAKDAGLMVRYLQGVDNS